MDKTKLLRLSQAILLGSHVLACGGAAGPQPPPTPPMDAGLNDVGTADAGPSPDAGEAPDAQLAMDAGQEPVETIYCWLVPDPRCDEPGGLPQGVVDGC